MRSSNASFPKGPAGAVTITTATVKRTTRTLRWCWDRSLLAAFNRRTRPLRSGGRARRHPFHPHTGKIRERGRHVSEQVWDEEDLPEARMKRGAPTGAAMPLCWAHAEYLTSCEAKKTAWALIASLLSFNVTRKQKPKVKLKCGALPIDPPASKRQNAPTHHASISTVRWTTDGWQTASDLETRDTGLGCWFADLPAASLATGAKIIFTFRWTEKWKDAITPSKSVVEPASI